MTRWARVLFCILVCLSTSEVLADSCSDLGDSAEQPQLVFLRTTHASGVAQRSLIPRLHHRAGWIQVEYTEKGIRFANLYDGPALPVEFFRIQVDYYDTESRLLPGSSVNFPQSGCQTWSLFPGQSSREFLLPLLDGSAPEQSRAVVRIWTSEI